MNRKSAASRKATWLTPYLFMAPAGAILVVALLYPIAYVIYAGFLDWNPSQTVSEARFVGLQNYAKLVTDASFLESLRVTLRFAASVVALEMILGVGLALLLDRPMRGVALLRTLFILPMMIAPIVVGLMWRYMYHPTVGIFNRTLKALGLPGAPWLSDPDWAFVSVVVADVWQWTPFIFILSLAALQSLPRSSLEAARIDGASRWQTVLYVKLPLMIPVLIVTMLLRLIDAFKVLEAILVMTNGGPGLATEILALRINRTAFEFRALGEAAAMANLLLLVLMALTLVMFVYTKGAEARTRRLQIKTREAA
jgi:multiple sugar transport system permease protein